MLASKCIHIYSVLLEHYSDYQGNLCYAMFWKKAQTKKDIMIQRMYFSTCDKSGEIRGRVIYQRKKTEPSVLLLSLGFEKPKVRFWATYDGRIFFPLFFFFSPGYALPVVG